MWDIFKCIYLFINMRLIKEKNGSLVITLIALFLSGSCPGVASALPFKPMEWEKMRANFEWRCELTGGKFGGLGILPTLHEMILLQYGLGTYVYYEHGIQCKDMVYTPANMELWQKMGEECGNTLSLFELKWDVRRKESPLQGEINARCIGLTLEEMGLD